MAPPVREIAGMSADAAANEKRGRASVAAVASATELRRNSLRIMG
jgi:hypothetical protein